MPSRRSTEPVAVFREVKTSRGLIIGSAGRPGSDTLPRLIKVRRLIGGNDDEDDEDEDEDDGG